MTRLIYRKIYKYMLDQHLGLMTDVRPKRQVEIDGWVTLHPNGWLTISLGYSWDGPSGPARDTENFMRASLVHDALYQLIEERKLSKRYRKAADKTMRRLCKEDGMGWFRRNYSYAAVRMFGGRHV